MDLATNLRRSAENLVSLVGLSVLGSCGTLSCWGAQRCNTGYTQGATDEVAWARGVAGSGEHLLALLVLAKCFGRLGYFPALAEVSAVVVEHVRRDLGLAEDLAAVYTSRAPACSRLSLVRQVCGR